VSSRRGLVLTVVVLVILVSAFLRLWGLGRPGKYIFDEVYYAKDAKAIIHGRLGPKPGLHWEPGDEISWPHAEYGKFLISLGILALGDDAFGWRFASALAGIALIACVYPLARRLGLSPGWALAALVLAAADMLGIAQSRIADLDIFVALWTAVCLLCALRYVQGGHRFVWLLLTGLAGGLALGTKWSGALALLTAGVVVVLFRRRAARMTREAPADATPAVNSRDNGSADERDLFADRGPVPFWPADRPSVAARLLAALRAALLPVACLIVLPAALYVLSYVLYFVHGHGWSDWVELQRQMVTFNFHLKATHTYASLSPTWIVVARPVWYFFEGKVEYHGIVAMGNPLLWWTSILALVALPVTAIIERNRALVMPALLVALLYFPWFAATRTSFLYYMTPVAPFLAILVAAALARLAGEPPTLPAATSPARASADKDAGLSLGSDELESGAARPSEMRGLVCLLVFVLVAVATALFWYPFGRAVGYLFYVLPSRSAPALGVAATTIGVAATTIGVAAAAIGFSMLIVKRRFTPLWRYFAWAYVGGVVGLAAAFLPIIVDIAIAPERFYHLMWFKSWI
jgi:dolichyl-phosphate-mannose--protein O-mannosyl transferase